MNRLAEDDEEEYDRRLEAMRLKQAEQLEKEKEGQQVRRSSISMARSELSLGVVEVALHLRASGRWGSQSQRRARSCRRRPASPASLLVALTYLTRGVNETSSRLGLVHVNRRPMRRDTGELRRL